MWTTNVIASEPFWTFAGELLVKATLLLLAAELTVRVLRRSSAALRHLVWTLSLGLLLVLPVYQLCEPRWSLPQIPIATKSVTSPPAMPRSTAVQQHPVQQVGIESSSFEQRHSDVSTVSLPLQSPEAAANAVTEVFGSPERIAIATENDRLAKPSVPSAKTSSETPIAILRGKPSNSLHFWSRALIVLWAAVAALLLAQLLISMIQIWRVGRRTACVRNREWRNLLEESQKLCRVGGQVRLVQSATVTSPQTWGVMRPTIALPDSLNDWPLSARHVVLLHELAHIKRQDVLVQILARCCCALYWLHPLAWRAFRKLREEREQACDDFVLQTGQSAEDYARALVLVARSGIRVRDCSTVAMAAGVPLERRVRSILSESANRQPVGWRVALMLLLVALLGGGAISTLGIRQAAGQSEKPVEASNPPTVSPEIPSDDPPDDSKSVPQDSEVHVLLSGTVLDSDDQPIADAQVFLCRLTTRPGILGPPIAKTRCNAAGEFDLLWEGEEEFKPMMNAQAPFVVIAIAPGQTIRWKILSEPTQEPLVLKLEPAHEITGTVIDKQGQPVFAAVVRVREILPLTELISQERLRKVPRFLLPHSLSLNWPRSPLRTYTDRQGRFTISGVPHSSGLVLKLEDDRYLETTVHACANAKHPLIRQMQEFREQYASVNYQYGTPVQTGDVKIVADAGLSLTVKVVDEETGEPIAGANCSTQDFFGPDRVTSEKGLAKFEGIPFTGVGCLVIVVPPVDTPYLPGTASVDPVSRENGSVIVRLKKGRKIRGRVIDQQTRQPVPNVQMTWTPGTVGTSVMETGNTLYFGLGTPFDSRRHSIALTDESGMFELTAEDKDGSILVLRPNGYRLIAPVSVPKYSEESTDPTNDELIEIELVRSPPITGRVVRPDGSPVEGARVWTNTLHENLGTAVNSPYYTQTPNSSQFQPASPISLSHVTTNGITDADGRFELTDVYLQPLDDGSLTAVQDVHTPTKTGQEKNLNSREVARLIMYHEDDHKRTLSHPLPVLSSLTESPELLELVLPGPTKLVGQVVDSQTGEGVLRAELMVYQLDEDKLQALTWHGRSGPDGNFWFHELESGHAYAIGVQHDGFEDYFPPLDAFQKLEIGEEVDLGQIPLIPRE